MSNLPNFQYSPDEIKNMLQQILLEAKKEGATSAEVELSLNKGFAVTTRKVEVESVEYNQDKTIGLTVYMGKRTGTVTLSDIRFDEIKKAVKAACNIARYTDEDPYAGLADRDLLAFNYPKIDLLFPWHLSVAEAIEMAKACETLALEKDKRIVNSEGVTISTHEVFHAYANTEDFMGFFPATHHEISCMLIAKENQEMQRDYSYSVAADPSLLLPIQKIAAEAVEKTVKKLGSKQLSTRRTPVIFIAEEARGLWGHLIEAISGGNLYRKASFLLDHLGKTIFPSFVTIEERPHLDKMLGSAPYDDNGVATRPNIFVERGVLQSYVLGVYSARKLNMQTTGNAGGVHNLLIHPNEKDLAGLLKTMHTGLLVTELLGSGVNLVTGDYSRGCSGFWIENGQICYPVDEITIAGNLRDMFKNMVAVGNDIDTRGNIQTGSVLIENMMIAGH